MSLSKGDLILHPVRFRILRALGNRALTTQEISARLPDTPTSSIYRHLKLLLEGELVVVAETQLVKGIEEKTYRITQRPYLGAEDIKGVAAPDHIRYFTSYVLSLIQEYADYVEDAAGETGTIDMIEDRTGYTEITFYASKSELDQLAADINAAILNVVRNPPGPERKQRKLAIIAHPLKENDDGTTT